MTMFGRKKRQSRDEDSGRYDEYEFDEYGYEDDESDDIEADYDEPGYGGRRHARARYDEPGYDEAGYEQAAYDESGYDDEYGESGYDEPRYPRAGYGETGYDDTGHHPAEPPDPGTGPYTYDDVAHRLDEITEQRLDLGSVILPVPPGGQLQVEMTPDGTPQAVHLATEYGRLTVAAYAAPKSPGQWRSVAADLADSLRNDGAQVSMQTGPWGRELHAVTQGADLRFIGVDGYRWMLRLVAAGPSGAADEGLPLVDAARAVVRETVVRRGDEPLPVREPLPVVLPQELADQLVAAHQQQQLAQQQALAAQAAAAQAAATGQFPAVTPNQPPPPRRGAEGSAMQQLRRN
jgi:hypothetical protein